MALQRLRNDPEAGWELRNRTFLWGPDFLMVSQDCIGVTIMVSGGGVWEPQRDEIEGVGEMVGEGGVVGCLRGSSVVGEISLCSLRSPSPHKRLQLQLQWHSLQTTPPYASRRLPRELTVTHDGPARPNPDMD